MKLVIEADIPTAELIKKFLEHIREFDLRNKTCHFQITACTGLTTEEAAKLLNSIFPFVYIYKEDQKD